MSLPVHGDLQVRTSIQSVEDAADGADEPGTPTLNTASTRYTIYNAEAAHILLAHTNTLHRHTLYAYYMQSTK
jgi:hypothetical protein